MAICEACGEEMMEVDGCETDGEGIGYRTEDGSIVRHQLVPFGSETRFTAFAHDDKEARCPDCNAKRGHVHHPGCDVEECPNCHRQMLSCSCEIVVGS